jgi:hypothetical protein
MGYGCPDGKPCDADYYGFWNQVYLAGWQINQYPKGDFTFKAFRSTPIAFNPDPNCGSTNVYIENWATAALYNYTPYQPNAEALKAGYNPGNYCSSYGNRNVFLFYNDWFGSSHAYNFKDISKVTVERSADIKWLADYRITSGCTSKKDKFCPNNPVNRGSMAQFLLRMTGQSEGSASTSPFADVSLKNQKIQYAGANKASTVSKLDAQRIYAINWLVTTGITVGSGSTVDGALTYRPWDPVNRGSMAQFLMRSSGIPDPILYDAAVSDPTLTPVYAPDADGTQTIAAFEVDSTLTTLGNPTGVWYQPVPVSLFPDVAPVPVSVLYLTQKAAVIVPEVSLDRIYAINWLAQTGVTVGSGVNSANITTYRAQDPVTRGSMAQFLHRMRNLGLL